MLSLILVLLVAGSAFAAPSVGVSQYGINEIAPIRDNGVLVSSYLTDSAVELVNNGDLSISILTILQILNDVANLGDSQSQALAVSQTIAILGELATGVAGNSCDSAALVNAWAEYLRTGNNVGLNAALANYLGRVAINIDLIAQIANNPNALRYANGPVGNCVGGGRVYDFEASWDNLLKSANPSQLSLLNEEYCAAKRLYTALNVRSNNVGAAVSAASIRPVTKIISRALVPLANFLRAAITGNNVSQAAAVAKSAIRRAAN